MNLFYIISFVLILFYMKENYIISKNLQKLIDEKYKKKKL